MKTVHTKGAMLVGIGISGACSLSTIWFGACSFCEGDIKGGTGFIVISMMIILFGIVMGLSIYCTHWIRYGSGSIVIRCVSKKIVNGRPIGKLETECFFRLKNGEMIGYEVGYYGSKDIDDLYHYIFEETGLEFQGDFRKVIIKTDSKQCEEIKRQKSRRGLNYFR